VTTRACRVQGLKLCRRFLPRRQDSLDVTLIAFHTNVRAGQLETRHGVVLKGQCFPAKGRMTLPAYRPAVGASELTLVVVRVAYPAGAVLDLVQRCRLSIDQPLRVALIARYGNVLSQQRKPGDGMIEFHHVPVSLYVTSLATIFYDLVRELARMVIFMTGRAGKTLPVKAQRFLAGHDSFSVALVARNGNVRALQLEPGLFVLPEFERRRNKALDGMTSAAFSAARTV